MIGPTSDGNLLGGRFPVGILLVTSIILGATTLPTLTHAETRPCPSPGTQDTAATRAAGESALSILDEAMVSTTGRPITGGVPLPEQAGITSTSQVELLDAGGEPIPAQMTVLSRWGAAPDDPTRPIRWLLLDYQTDLDAGEARDLSVHYDNAGSFDHPVSTPISTSEDGTHITVDTGAASFRIKKNGNNFFDQVLIGETTILDAAQADMIVTIGGVPRRSSLGTSAAEIELAGPLRTVVGIYGHFQNNVLDYTVRLHFFAGKSSVRAFLRLENNTVCGNSEDRDNFGSVGQYTNQTCHCLESPGRVLFSDASIELS